MGKLSELMENGFKEKEKPIEEIYQEIKNHRGHGTESNPEQYGQIFFNILMLSKVPKNDLERYSEYVLGTLRQLIKTEVDK